MRLKVAINYRRQDSTVDPQVVLSQNREDSKLSNNKEN